MDDKPTDSRWGFWAAYLAIVGVIVLVGWKQPLSYRFMTAEKVEALEHPATPVPVTPVQKPATPSPEWMWKKTGRPDPLAPTPK